MVANLTMSLGEMLRRSKVPVRLYTHSRALPSSLRPNLFSGD